MKIIVSRQELATALLFASTDDSRYVLNGVNIEFPPGAEKRRLVATDGRRLAVIQSLAEQAEEPPAEGASILIRPDYIKLFVSFSKACGGKVFPWLMLEPIAQGKGLCVSTVGGKANLVIEEGALIDGHYPEWQKTLPNKRAIREPISDLGLNSEYIGDFGKAAKLLECSPIIQMNLVGKEKCIEARITGCEQFYGLLMQCKLDEELEYQPEFVGIISQLPKEEEEEVESTRNEAA